MKSFSTFFIVTVVFALITLPAMAQEPEVPEHSERESQQIGSDDIEKAQEYFDLGAQLFYEGQYSRAAVEFRRAHEQHPHPLFLFNMALCFQRLGRHEDALNVARQAQQMDEPLPAEQDARNRGIIAGVETSLMGRDVAESRAEEPEIDEVPEPVTVEESGFSALGWAGVATAGVGVASLVGGGLLQSQLTDNREVYEARQERHPDSETVGELGDIIATQQTQRTTLFISGASLTAIGTALIVMGARSTGGAAKAEARSDVELSFSIVDPGVWATFRW